MTVEECDRSEMGAGLSDPHERSSFNFPSRDPLCPV
jgi:hypothetical protein